MTTLNGYGGIATHLIDPEHGCIPWAIEWMIRYKGNVTGSWEIPSNQLNNFQTTYNVYRQTHRAARNTYASVLRAIEANHPGVGFVRDNTYQRNQAMQKFQQIENLIGQGTPCITTIRLLPHHNAHIVPVVEINPNDIAVIWNIPNTGIQQIQRFSKNSLYQMHNAGRGMGFMYLP